MSLLRDRSFKISIILTSVFFGIGIIFLFLGLASLSWILFVLLPITLGISIGALPNRKTAMWGAFAATAILLVCLGAFGFSGFICIVMALPFIISILFIVSIIMHLIKRYRQIKHDKLPVLFLPLIPFLIAAPAEQFLNKDRKEVLEIKTEKVFNYTCEEVYDAIKSVDTLDAEKPFLMHFDLPVPTKCVLEKEEVGALRTCYFKSGNLSRFEFGGGTITEKVTQIEKGKVLKMDVIDYDLTGRTWLGFKEAIYYFEKVDNTKCKLIRITTYTSELTPRFYWEPMEKLGIEQEHDYVFNNLEKDLKNKYKK
ncbi:MAG: polyketide cyclase [Bacteroidetes bacterium]|jgi:hypothetical protein|nr:polyketide cyclase [Bacteroidota bacterium]